MNIQIFPLNNYPSQDQTMTLNGQSIRFSFRYNDYMNCFIMGLTDVLTNTMMLDGCPLLRGEDLLAPYNFNLGSIYVMAVWGEDGEMTLDNVGITTFLTWDGGN